MENKVWDLERLRTVGSILARYSAHLAEGHRVRLGLEGDPCSVYRNADDAPTGTVVQVNRPDDESGIVRFVAKMDADGSLVELDNCNVDPTKVWEIDPLFLDEFRGHIADDGMPPDTLPVHSTRDDYEDYRGKQRLVLAD